MAETEAARSAKQYANEFAFQRIVNDAGFERAYAGLKKNSVCFIENCSDVTAAHKKAIDDNMFDYLRYRFQNAAGVNITAHNTSEVFEDTILRRQLASAIGLPPQVRSIDNFVSFQKSGELSRAILKTFIDSTPALRGFSVNDAVNFASGGTKEVEAKQKFAGVDPNILKAVSYITLSQNKDSLPASHPDFYRAHKDKDFGQLATLGVFTQIEDNNTYKKWEEDKRNTIIDRIIQDPALMADIAKIKAPANLNTVADIQTQMAVKERVADKIGMIYADVYEHRNIDKNDINVIYTHAAVFEQAGGKASAFSTVPGVQNDEAIIIRENPIHALLTGKGKKDSNASEQLEFLETVIEETQHTTDKIHADQYVSGTMPSTHPAYTRTPYMILNQANYAPPEGYEYHAQFVERTAKSVASEMAFLVTHELSQAPALVDAKTPSAAPISSNPAR